MPVQVTLSLVWFFYFAGVGIFFPFLSLYLRENVGLSGTEVGFVLSVWPLVGMLAQPFWGQLADRTGARRTILTILTAGTALSILSLGLAQSFLTLSLAAAFTALFSTSVIPMMFAVSLGTLRDRGPNAFGFTRVWATISFLLLVVGFPWMLEGYERLRGLSPVSDGPSQPGLALMFPVIAVFSLLAAGGTLFLPRGGHLAVRARPSDWRLLLGHPPIRRLLAFNFLAYLCIQGPMALFPVWVSSRGGSIDTVGQMWLVMLILEIPLVAYSGVAARRIGAARLLQLGTAAAGLRWFLCGVLTDFHWLYAIQVLHAAVVAGTMIGGPLYLESIVPERLRSTGQSLLAMVSGGLGGSLSNLATGWLMDQFGVDAAFMFGGAGAMFLALVAGRLLVTGDRLQ